MQQWSEMAQTGDDTVDVRYLLSSESEMLQWKSRGLPGDALSIENAVVMLHGHLTGRWPFVVDPAGRAAAWLERQLTEKGGELRLLRPQPHVRHVMQIIKALPVDEIFDSEEELDAYLDEVQRKIRNKEMPPGDFRSEL